MLLLLLLQMLVALLMLHLLLLLLPLGLGGPGRLRPTAPASRDAGLLCWCGLLRLGPTAWLPWWRANACLHELHAALVDLQTGARRRACYESQMHTCLPLRQCSAAKSSPTKPQATHVVMKHHIALKTAQPLLRLRRWPSCLAYQLRCQEVGTWRRARVLRRLVLVCCPSGHVRCGGEVPWRCVWMLPMLPCHRSCCPLLLPVLWRGAALGGRRRCAASVPGRRWKHGCALLVWLRDCSVRIMTGTQYSVEVCLQKHRPPASSSDALPASPMGRSIPARTHLNRLRPCAPAQARRGRRTAPAIPGSGVAPG